MQVIEPGAGADGRPARGLVPSADARDARAASASPPRCRSTASRCRAGRSATATEGVIVEWDLGAHRRSSRRTRTASTSSSTSSRRSCSQKLQRLSHAMVYFSTNSQRRSIAQVFAAVQSGSVHTTAASRRLRRSQPAGCGTECDHLRPARATLRGPTRSAATSFKLRTCTSNAYARRSSRATSSSNPVPHGIPGLWRQRVPGASGRANRSSTSPDDTARRPHPEASTSPTRCRTRAFTASISAPTARIRQQGHGLLATPANSAIRSTSSRLNGGLHGRDPRAGRRSFERHRPRRRREADSTVLRAQRRHQQRRIRATRHQPGR